MADSDRSIDQPPPHTEQIPLVIDSMLALKRAVRTEVRTKLKEVTPALLAKQGSMIQKNFLESQEFSRAKSIAVYLNLPDEVPTNIILENVFEPSTVPSDPDIIYSTSSSNSSLSPTKRVFVPRIIGDDIKMLLVKGKSDYESFPKNKWNIAEPPLDADRESAVLDAPLDLIVVPGVAFDRDGRRLGRGKGFYDRFLNYYFSECTKKGFSRPMLVALAFREQMVDRIPTEAHDIPMDKVFTIGPGVTLSGDL